MALTRSVRSLLSVASRRVLAARGCQQFVVDEDDQWETETSTRVRLPRFRSMTKEKWDYYGNVVWPPRHVDELTDAPKAAEVFHSRENVKYSPKKMWYICHFIRGQSVDEALKQLEFVRRKGAVIVTDIIREAKAAAATQHCIEYPSNMWIAEAGVTDGLMIKGKRRHAKNRWATIHYRHCNVFVRLEEGQPPAYTTRDPPQTGWLQMKEHVDYLRDRRLKYSL